MSDLRGVEPIPGIPKPTISDRTGPPADYELAEHPMVCGATVPGVDHEHACHQRPRRPDQTYGLAKHACHLCPTTWTEQTTCRMTLRPVDTSWVTTEPAEGTPRWSWVAVFVGGAVAVILVVTGIVWLVAR